MNNFTYYNQTRYVFGHGEYNNIGTLLQGKCKKLLLHYGGGSIKRSGLYDAVVKALQDAGIDFIELGGVKPNPCLTMVREGVELCRNSGVDCVLAVGGGSVIDSAKAIATGVVHEGDVWKLYTHEETLTATPCPLLRFSPCQPPAAKTAPIPSFQMKKQGENWATGMNYCAPCSAL